MIISPRRRTSRIAARTAVAIMEHALIISVMNSKHTVYADLFPVRYISQHTYLATRVPPRYQKCYVSESRISDKYIANDIPLIYNDIPSYLRPRTEGDGVNWIFCLLSFTHIYFYFSRHFAHLSLYFFLIHVSWKLFLQNIPVKGTVISYKYLFTYASRDSFVYISMLRQIVSNEIKKRFLRESTLHGVY